MPIFVQWKWDDGHEDFLVIFHFDADYSKFNLRTQRMKFRDSGGFRYYTPAFLNFPTDSFHKEASTRTVMTWAPSHVELALLTEVLTYANIINGLKPNIRKELRNKLEMLSFFKGRKLWFDNVAKREEELGSWELAEESLEVEINEGIRKELDIYHEDYIFLRKMMKNRTILVTDYVTGTSFLKARKSQLMFFEICPEYIDYLKEVLKPYMKG